MRGDDVRLSSGEISTAPERDRPPAGVGPCRIYMLYPYTVHAPAAHPLPTMVHMHLV